MTRAELISRIATTHRDIPHAQIEEIVCVIFTEINKALAAGGRVELRGFGTFSLRKRPQRAGRNPRTGEPVAVREKAVPFFKTGKELRHLLNPS